MHFEWCTSIINGVGLQSLAIWSSLHDHNSKGLLSIVILINRANIRNPFSSVLIGSPCCSVSHRFSTNASCKIIISGVHAVIEFFYRNLNFHNCFSSLFFYMPFNSSQSLNREIQILLKCHLYSLDNIYCNI